MELFDILKNLYTNPKSDWILGIEDNKINPHLIQRFISLNPKTTKHARFLNKFTYKIPPKMYLSAAWSILFFDGQKLNKAPFTQYPKKQQEEDYEFILKKIRKQYQLSDKDFEVNKPFLLKAIKKDKAKWFAYYGISKSFWQHHKMDQKLEMERHGTQRPEKQIKTGLDEWM